MQLKDKLKDDAGFAYVVDELEIMSSAGKQMLMSQEWQNDANALRKEWGNVAAMAKAMQAQENKKATLDLRHQMMELQDLKGTLRNLQAGMTIDEIELFQVKQFAFHTVKTRRAAEAMKINHILMLPDMAPTFELLDPDHSGVPTFYVYDSYEPALTPLRKELSTLQNALAKLETLGDMHLNDSQRNEMAALHDRISDLLTQQDNLQDEVLKRLSLRLHDDVDTLATAMTQMAYTDMLQAKAMQAIDWNLTQPELRDGNVSSFVQIVNPRLQRRNKEQHLRYQPVDIELRQGVCFITGANMAGKTVLLKTVGCAQMMAQFGMFVPAREASISLVDDVVFCIGDKQNEMNGLSSFASEIIKISGTLARSAQRHLLILIDEPARTTNPIEGKAIVHAIGEILNRRNSLSLITTHYSGLGLQCRRLRVKGFVESLSDAPLSPATINRFMDYSLLPDDSDDAPQEALRIATILGCDEEMIRLAKQALANANE